MTVKELKEILNCCCDDAKVFCWDSNTLDYANIEVNELGSAYVYIDVEGVSEE